MIYNVQTIINAMQNKHEEIENQATKNLKTIKTNKIKKFLIPQCVLEKQITTEIY